MVEHGVDGYLAILYYIKRHAYILDATIVNRNLIFYVALILGLALAASDAVNHAAQRISFACQRG